MAVQKWKAANLDTPKPDIVHATAVAENDGLEIVLDDSLIGTQPDRGIPDTRRLKRMLENLTQRVLEYYKGTV